jgi:hypothetical protein
LITSAEIEALRFILEKEWPEGTSTDVVAKAAIKALDDLRSTTWRPVGPPLKTGQAFKHQYLSGTQFIAWIGEDDGREMAWVVHDASDYGCYASTSSPFWKWTTPVALAKGVNRTVKVKVLDEHGREVLDENGDNVFESIKKYYPPVHERVFVNTLGMAVGDKVRLRQYNRFEVIAVHQNGVLLKERDSGQIYPECNSDLKERYEDGW